MIEELPWGGIPVPGKKENCIPIVMTSSEAYLPYTCVAIHSILRHRSPGLFYDILLLNCQDYSREGLSLLEGIAAKEDNVRIGILNVRYWMTGIPHTAGHISAETYARLFLPAIMQNYENIIYLDSDLIVRRDVAQLLAGPAAGTELSGVPDLDVIGQYYGSEFSMKYYLDKKLAIPNVLHYLQAGVLVCNIPKIRKRISGGKLVERGLKSRLRYFDQDILNCLCHQDVRILDFRWNVVSDCHHYRVERIISQAPQDYYQRYLSSRKAPWIIHFSGEQKPWNDPHMDFADSFYAYAQEAGLAEMIGERVSEGTVEPKMKKLCSRLLPQQSFARELCKTVYFAFAYQNLIGKTAQGEMAK